MAFEDASMAIITSSDVVLTMLEGIGTPDSMKTFSTA